MTECTRNTTPEPPKVVATLLPLCGKYYGTKIQIDYGDPTPIVLNIWKFSSTMSKRQLDYFELDPADTHEINDSMSDGHFESGLTFMVADLLVKRLNNLTQDEVREFIAGI